MGVRIPPLAPAVIVKGWLGPGQPFFPFHTDGYRQCTSGRANITVKGCQIPLTMIILSGGSGDTTGDVLSVDYYSQFSAVAAGLFSSNIKLKK